MNGSDEGRDEVTEGVGMKERAQKFRGGKDEMNETGQT